jgi:hypothetical protein
MSLLIEKINASRRQQPSEERNEKFYPIGEILKGMLDMLHNKAGKSKGENKLRISECGLGI